MFTDISLQFCTAHRLAEPLLWNPGGEHCYCSPLYPLAFHWIWGLQLPMVIKLSGRGKGEPSSIGIHPLGSETTLGLQVWLHCPDKPPPHCQRWVTWVVRSPTVQIQATGPNELDNGHPDDAPHHLHGALFQNSFLSVYVYLHACTLDWRYSSKVLGQAASISDSYH